jgi:hypothetical protein
VFDYEEILRDESKQYEQGSVCTRLGQGCPGFFVLLVADVRSHVQPEEMHSTVNRIDLNLN